MNCPKCGKESVKDALYCEWCGTSLGAENRNKIYLIYNSKKSINFYSDNIGVCIWKEFYLK